MLETENYTVPGSTNDSWRTWLMTGARRNRVDRRRMRGAHKGLKKMLLEGMSNGEERPHAWKDFSGAMIRHAVDDAMRTLPAEDKQVVKLAYFGGYSNREIATETGLTEATVQRRLRRALSAISEHIQHGKALGRKAMYALMVWLSGRWLYDAAPHVATAVAVAAVTVIIVAQPVTPGVTSHGATPAVQAGDSKSKPVVPPLPSPTIPAHNAILPAPAVPPSSDLPTLPTPPVQLPVALPTPPVHVPLRA